MVKFYSSPVTPVRITSGYGDRDTGIVGATTTHPGLDFGGDKSLSQTSVLAVADGVVIQNYWNNVRGWVIYIRHNGFDTLSQHLKFQSPLKIGSSVKAGQQIGIMGNSSNALTIAVHLHFEVRVGGLPIDPTAFVDNIGKEFAVTYDDFKIFIARYQEELGKQLASSWAKDEITDAVKNGITDGTKPQAYATRQEVMLMVNRSRK